MSELDQKLARYQSKGLRSISQIRILLALEECRGLSIRPTLLSKLSGVHTANIGTMLNKLTDLGLANRKKMAITKQGTDLIQ